MPFLISSRIDDDTISLHAEGDVDMAAEVPLQRAIDESLDIEGADSLVLDLTDVMFMDCAGLAALLYGRRMADERGRLYRIQGAHGIALTVLRVTGVLDYLTHESAGR